MEVTECNGILEAGPQNGGNDSSLHDGPEEENSEDEENDENWENVLPVEVNIETAEEDVKTELHCPTSDSESDFYGFEDGEIPVKKPAKSSKLSKTSSHCPHCSYKTRRKDHLKRHVLRQHPEQTLYPDGGRRVSLPIKSRSCPECGYTTRRLDHLKRHIMRHTGEKPFSCACGYSTTHAIHLKRHILRRANDSAHYPVPANRPRNQKTDAVVRLDKVSPVESPRGKEIEKKKLGRPRKVLVGDSRDKVLAHLASRGVVLAQPTSKHPPNKETVKTEYKDTPPPEEIKNEVTEIKEGPANKDYGEWSIGVWPADVSLNVENVESDVVVRSDKVSPVESPGGKENEKKKRGRPRKILAGDSRDKVLAHLASRGVVLAQPTSKHNPNKETVKTEYKDTPPPEEIKNEVTEIKEEHVNKDYGEWSIGVWPADVSLNAGDVVESDEENKVEKRNRKQRANVQPHVCEICGYSTMRGDHFKRHLMRHTGEKPYSCSFCDYRSTHAIHLKRHLSTHTNDRPFRCEFCPFRAIRPHHLRDHVRLHTGERPYNCHLCEFSAAQSGNYRAHMRTHSAEKPHVCEICGYSTVKSSNLATHMRTHTGETGHACQQCDYRAVKPSEVARHVQLVHGTLPA